MIFVSLFQKEGGAKKRKKGTKKDPNAPKRPMSAYFLWLNENREQIKSDNPGASVADIAKKGGELWRELKDKSVRGLPPISVNALVFCKGKYFFALL